MQNQYHRLDANEFLNAVIGSYVINNSFEEFNIAI